jgi:hypothetical protein
MINLGFQIDKLSMHVFENIALFSSIAVIDSKMEIQPIKDKDKEEG